MTLCDICVGMLQRGEGTIWTGTLDPTFEHHKDTASLKLSFNTGCTICVGLARLFCQDGKDLTEDRRISIRAVVRKLQTHQEEFLKVENATDAANGYSVPSHNRAQLLEELRSEVDALIEEDISTKGIYQNELQQLKHDLQRLANRSNGFRLDFDIEKSYTRTFLLLPCDHDTSVLKIPTSMNTSSDEVFEKAFNWIRRCEKTCACSKRTDPNWYPKRLLDLKDLKEAHGIKGLGGIEVNIGNVDLQKARVRLVDGSKAKGRYVTLSHCWGKPNTVQGLLRLTGRTEQKFRKEGIELRDLCKSFRDAMLFAYRLDQVRYIWIDSLCIIQPDPLATDDFEDPSEQDWKEQSRVMGEVYRQSYLNISATAAKDGNHGLFVSRHPEDLWENEIILNKTITDTLDPNQGRAFSNSITRCTLVDLTLWADLVEHAPVNTRGWVQQERLLSPRIIHFCHNQIAWECGGFQDVESQPNAYTTITVKHGDIINERHLKDFDDRRGLRLRASRLRGFPDPDKTLPRLGIYELWKYVVEVYSCTQLSFSRDKLIALSGIAEQFSRDTKCGYVAGMWREHLESQLLWQVNEVYRDGIFDNPACRDAQRAPSFSWAAIDSPYGVTYGETTDYGRERHKQLLFEVTGYKLHLGDPENPFGLVNSGQLHIRPRYLHRITLRKLGSSSYVPYSWLLQEDPSPKQDLLSKQAHSKDIVHKKETSLSNEKAFLEHYNLNLDAPGSDIDVFADEAEVFCMPAAFGDRTVKEDSRDLICLLLLKVDPSSKHQFRRIGITRLSKTVDWKSHAILMKQRFQGGEIMLL